MGRHKGGTNRYYTLEEKLRIALRAVNDGISAIQIAKEENINRSLVGKWMRDYLKGGKEALKNKKKPGNPLVRYQSKKELTELEKLEYENMKLKIENARLKKGYTNEEVISIRQRK
jgi:transposase-like protein